MTGDLDANLGDLDGPATQRGDVQRAFWAAASGADGAGANGFSFAGLHGTTGVTVGTRDGELQLGVGNMLTATIDDGGRATGPTCSRSR